MPRPSAELVAVGIVAAAVALTLQAIIGRRAKRTFLRALSAYADQHERLERVVVFGARRNGRTMSDAVRGGVAFVRRLVTELEDGETS
jgi:hypothetical protein